MLHLVTRMLSLALALPGGESLCSRIPDPLPPFAGSLHLTGVATADTVAAGPGAVRYGLGGGHFGPGTAGIVFGQRVRVARLARTASDDVRRAVEAHGEVVLVPWDHGPGCRPVRWTRSARWMAAGTNGAFVAQLRERSHWVDGRPTLDVHAPQFVPYPVAPALARRLTHEAARGAPLSADELIDLYDALTPLAAAMPSGDAADTLSLTRALDARLGWEREHAALVARYPARLMVSTMLNEATRWLVAARAYPEEGTYCVRVVLASGDSSVFFLRTISGRAQPVSPWELGEPSPPRQPRAPGTRETRVGVLHYVAIARQVEELPRRAADMGPPWEDPPKGYFGVLDSTSADADGTRRAQLYFGSAGRFVAADPVLVAAYGERPWIPGVGPQDYYPARLGSRDDGTIVAVHTIVRAGRPVATVTATRISREVVRR